MTSYTITATWSNRWNVTLDKSRRWAGQDCQPATFRTFAEAEAVYRRLLEIGTKATNIRIHGD